MTRGVVAIVVVLAVAALVRSVPRDLESLEAAWPVLRHWPDHTAQRRALLGPDLHDALSAADALLPPTAAVLLVTPGIRPRHEEYVVFHRALYHLTPRAVWWINAAAADGTWEARWWRSTPIDSPAVKRIAREHNAGFALFYDVSVPAQLAPSIRVARNAELIAVDAATFVRTGATEPESTFRRGLGVMSAVAIVLAAGLLVLGAARRAALDVGLIEALGLAWPLGAGAVSIAMLWATTALDFKQARLLVAIVVVAAAGFYVIRWRWHVSRELSRGPDRSLEGTPPPTARVPRSAGARPALLLALVPIVGAIAWVAVLAIGRPLSVWDSWVNWGMKARVLVDASGTLPRVGAILSDSSRAVTQLDYPLLIPIIEAWTMSWASSQDDRLAGIQAVLFFASVPAICFALCRRIQSSLAGALLVSAVAATTPLIARLSSSVFPDLPLAVYALIAGGYLVLWLRDGTTGALLVAALAGGFMPWTKREGVVLLAVLMLATALRRDPTGRWRRAILTLASAGTVIAGPWLALVWRYGLENPAFRPLSIESVVAGFDRLPFIAWRALSSLASAEWNFVWLSAAIVAVLRMRQARTVQGLLPLAALLYIAVMAFSYVFSTLVPYQQHVLASIDRLIAHVALWPLIWIGCGDCVSNRRREA